MAYLDAARSRYDPRDRMLPMDEIEIGAKGIRLGQLLKLANLAETGGNAKELLADGLVTVNGTIEVRRGAQLQAGDVVSCAGVELRLT